MRKNQQVTRKSVGWWKTIQLEKFGWLKTRDSFQILLEVVVVVLVIVGVALSIVEMVKGVNNPISGEVEERKGEELGDHKKEEIEEKISFWEEVVKLQPSYVLGYVKLGEYYLEMGNEAEAGEALEKAIAIDPNRSEVKMLGDKLMGERSE